MVVQFAKEGQVFEMEAGTTCRTLHELQLVRRNEKRKGGTWRKNTRQEAMRLLLLDRCLFRKEKKKKKTKNESREKRGGQGEKAKICHHGTQQCSNKHANRNHGMSLGFFHRLLLLCF